MALSVATILILGALFLIGTWVSAEISIAYYHEVLTTNYLGFLFSSVGLLIVGYKLSSYRYYSNAKLILNQDQMELVRKDVSTLLTADLIQQIEIEPLNSKKTHFIIITNNFVRRFPIKGNRELAKVLGKKYPEKIKKRATTTKASLRPQDGQ